MRSAAHGEAVQGDARYRHCWLIRFSGKTVIAIYRDHPSHLRHADQVFRPAAPERLTIDCMIG